MPLTFSIDAATLGLKYIGDRIKGRRPEEYEGSPSTANHIVSVIIPAYNAESSLEDTVESLYNQTLTPKNVIIVDDCSTDGTPDVCRSLEKEYSTLIPVRRDQNFGKATNINYAVTEFGDELGDITVVTDSDVLLDEKCLESMTKKFTSDEVAVVTPYGYTLPPKNPIARILHYGNSWNNEIFKFRKKAQSYRDSISVICGANTAYRTDILKKIPIPTRTKTEDTDYTWILQEAGYKIGYDEDAKVHSFDLEKPSGLLKQWFRWYSGTYQCLYAHGKELPKAKKMFWTTVLPSMAESIPYSFGIVTLPVFAALNVAMPGQIPVFGMEYVEGFAAADVLFTVVPTAAISPKYLARLPQIYAYKLVGSALTLGAFLEATYESITKQQHKWSNTWNRDYGFERDLSLNKITKKRMIEDLTDFFAIEKNWTDIGETAWDADNFLVDLPKKWELSFAAEKGASIAGYLIGSQGGENLANVNKILVDGPFRGKGIARKLFSKFEENCLENGITGIEMKALVENLPANQLYVSMGYSPVKVVEGADGKARNLYRKNLKERRLNESTPLKARNK